VSLALEQRVTEPIIHPYDVRHPLCSRPTQNSQKFSDFGEDAVQANGVRGLQKKQQEERDDQKVARRHDGLQLEEICQPVICLAPGEGFKSVI